MTVTELSRLGPRACRPESQPFCATSCHVQDSGHSLAGELAVLRPGLRLGEALEPQLAPVSRWTAGPVRRGKPVRHCGGRLSPEAIATWHLRA